MADNITTPGVGSVLATNDISGVHYPRSKSIWGPAGTANETDTASGKPMPVQLRASGGTELALATAAKQPALGTAGTASTDVITIQGIASGTVVPISVASLPSHAVTVASGGLASGSVVDGAMVTLGAKADAKSTATDTTAITAMQVLKQISASVQAIVAPGMSAAVSVTRPSDTTAYAANDVVGVTGGGTATMTFALGAVSGSRIMITSASLERDASAVISGETSYTLHLYNVTQPGAQIDNAVFDLATGDRTAYLGSINLGAPVDLGSTLYVGTDGINKQVKLAGTSLFGVLVTVGAYTPVSAAVHVVALHAVQM